MSTKILPKFKIEIINENDKDEVYEFALENFMKDEPLSKSLGLLDCKESKEYILSSLPDNCSFKAVNENGEIIGLVISGIKKRPVSGEVSKKGETENEKWKKIEVLMHYIESQWNIFDLYPNADRILDGKILAVDPNYRGLGIAGQLIARCKEYMKENNIQAMKRLCSSHFSARVMEKMGMKEVHREYYDNFKVNGEVWLQPAEPHKACRSFVLEI